MRKTGLVFIIFLITQTCFAAFPKPQSLDTTQNFPPLISSSNNLVLKPFDPLTQTRLSLTQKLAFNLLRHRLERKKSHKSTWLTSVGGFFLGLCLGPIGYGITRLTNNEPLREGANLGFRVFLYICAIYVVALLTVLVLFASLGFR